jgi:Tfp pilus assembly protein PilF
MLRLAAVALALALAGCASEPVRSLQTLFKPSEGAAALGQGIKLYEDGDYPAATKSFQAALGHELSDDERTNAYKHLAFIACSSGRPGACREEFRKVLTINPQFDLAPSEAGHPAWGPVFRSVKAEGQPLQVGLKQYDDGDYAESAKNLQGAIERGLPPGDLANAHKYLAFIHCSSGRAAACRDEFRKALAVDPQLDLAPSEAGHPAWGPVFRSVKAEGQMLQLGLKQYDDGAYREAARSLQGAIEHGLPPKDLAGAHKTLAFIHCSSGRRAACRDEFRKALAADPALELTPAEAGHPTWGPLFRSLKAGR